MRIHVDQYFEGETYHYRCCNQDLTSEETSDWKCIHCGNRVLIEWKSSRFIVRKLPTEIEKGEDVLLWDLKYYKVLSIEKIISMVHVHWPLKVCSSS